MTPDADIDGLVRRLRAQAGVTPAAYQPNVTLHMISPVEQPTLVMPSLLTEAAALIDALRKEQTRLEGLVYVPGVWRCAKCQCSVVSTTFHADSGRMSANSEPQQCPNNCGPMWRRTEREAGNELIDRMDAIADRASAAEQKLTEIHGIACSPVIVIEDKIARIGTLSSRSTSTNGG